MNNKFQEDVERLAAALEEASDHATLMPAQRYIGSGISVQNIMVVAVPVEDWERITVALTSLNPHRENE